MTIEEFEKRVKEIFIEKGWNNKAFNWYVLKITSFYKSKYMTVERCQNGQKFESHGQTYEEAFADGIAKLESCPK